MAAELAGVVPCHLVERIAHVDGIAREAGGIDGPDPEAKALSLALWAGGNPLEVHSAQGIGLQKLVALGPAGFDALGHSVAALDAAVVDYVALVARDSNSRGVVATVAHSFAVKPIGEVPGKGPCGNKLWAVQRQIKRGRHVVQQV